MTDRDVRETARGRTLSTFFCESLDGAEAGSERDLGSDEVTHVRAARLRPGARVAVIDGADHRWEAELVALERRRAVCRLVGSLPVPAPSPVKLWAPVGNRDRSLWMVEKVVELGVASIGWISYARSKSVADSGRSDAFLDRARARARAALKQSGRGRLPTLAGPISLDRALDEADRDEAAGGALRLLAERGGIPAWHVVEDRVGGRPGARPAVVAVGPEGGWTDGERDALSDGGFQRMSLGSGTLRFETAAVVAVGLLAVALDAGRKER